MVYLALAGMKEFYSLTLPFSRILEIIFTCIKYFYADQQTQHSTINTDVLVCSMTRQNTK